MDLSIVILNYNTKGLLKYCLKGIARAKPELRYEIIVIDNASSDGTAAMIQHEFKDVQFIPSPYNCGFAAGNNMGLRRAQGEYVMLMNPDIVVQQGALEAMVEYLKLHEDVGLVGPQLSNPDGSIQYSCAHFPTILTPLYRRTPLGRLPQGQQAVRSYIMIDADHTATQEVDWLLGACLMFKRKHIKTVGFLDERFFLYFEDTDFCRRFWEHHLKVVYLPHAHMIHYHRRMSANESILHALCSRPMRAHIASGFKYFWKYCNRALPR